MQASITVSDLVDLEGERYTMYMKIRNNKVVTYDLIQRGVPVYTGITNNPKARFFEHKVSGKQFQWLRVTSKSLSRRKAGYKETGDLIRHRRRYGQRSRYNNTWNGKYI